MCQTIVKTIPPCAYGLIAASLFILVAADGARAVPINSTPGAITCKVGEPGGVGEDFEGFFDPELNDGKGGLELDLGSFDSIDCGPNDPTQPPPLPPPLPPTLLPFSLESRPVVIVDDVALRYPGPTDLVLHGRYILHGKLIHE